MRWLACWPAGYGCLGRLKLRSGESVFQSLMEIGRRKSNAALTWRPRGLRPLPPQLPNGVVRDDGKKSKGSRPDRVGSWELMPN